MTEMTPEHFLPYLAKVFRVRGGRHVLTLSSVDTQQPIAHAPASIRRWPFNLIFAGQPRDVLPEGFYVLEIEGGPAVELYMMPVQTPARDRQDYQAVFN